MLAAAGVRRRSCEKVKPLKNGKIFWRLMRTLLIKCILNSSTSLTQKLTTNVDQKTNPNRHDKLGQKMAAIYIPLSRKLAATSNSSAML
jgi:hypothetical protein